MSCIHYTQLNYHKNFVDSVLGGLPAANIIGRRDDGAVITAEAFSDRADMLFRGQGELVSVNSSMLCKN